MKNRGLKDIFTVKVIIEDALFAALAIVLNMLKPNTPAGFFINVSLGFVPVAFLALKNGFLNGMLSGLIFGILDLFLRGLGTSNVISVTQAFFEYIIAFTLIGLAGLAHGSLKLSINKNKHAFAVLSILVGIFLGCLGKFGCHTIASATFFAKYLKVPKHGNIWAAAIIYQLPSFLSTFALATVCLVLIYAIRPSLYEDSFTD